MNSPLSFFVLVKPLGPVIVTIGLADFGAPLADTVNFSFEEVAFDLAGAAPTAAADMPMA